MPSSLCIYYLDILMANDLSWEKIAHKKNGSLGKKKKITDSQTPSPPAGTRGTFEEELVRRRPGFPTILPRTEVKKSRHSPYLWYQNDTFLLMLWKRIGVPSLERVEIDIVVLLLLSVQVDKTRLSWCNAVNACPYFESTQVLLTSVRKGALIGKGGGG